MKRGSLIDDKKVIHQDIKGFDLLEGDRVLCLVKDSKSEVCFSGIVTSVPDDDNIMVNIGHGIYHFDAKEVVFVERKA